MAIEITEIKTQKKYPQDFLNKIMEYFSSENGEHFKPSVFPSEEGLLEIIESLYHLTFLREENRSFQLNVSYTDPSETEFSDEKKTLEPKQYRFQTPLDFSTETLLKIAPSIHPLSGMLMLYEFPNAGSKSQKRELKIWGIAKLARQWWHTAFENVKPIYYFPGWLTFSAQTPGRLSASIKGRRIGCLSDGKIKPILSGNDLFKSGPISNFFEESINQLLSGVEHRPPRNAFFFGTLRAVLTDYYNSAIATIAQTAALRKHGASFLFVKGDSESIGHTLEPLINIKYRIFSEGWELFHELADIESILRETEKDHDTTNAKTFLELSNRKKQEFHEYVKFVTQLSEIDGAVVLTDKLRVLGFGGEITVQAESLENVSIASDSEGNDLTKRSIKELGTRHRSAFRFCNAYPECVAFIISQDGGIRVATRKDESVVVWEDIDFSKVEFL